MEAQPVGSQRETFGFLKQEAVDQADSEISKDPLKTYLGSFPLLRFAELLLERLSD